MLLCVKFSFKMTHFTLSVASRDWSWNRYFFFFNVSWFLVLPPVGWRELQSSIFIEKENLTSRCLRRDESVAFHSPGIRRPPSHGWVFFQEGNNCATHAALLSPHTRTGSRTPLKRLFNDVFDDVDVLPPSLHS